MSQSSLIDLSNVSVMCIDDDPVIRSVIRFALQRHGCSDVVQAHSGGEALDLCAGRNFDLVICDFQMSPMNGLDFLRELAESGIGEGWKVIMLSAETNPATIQEAQELGVRAWIAKPVSVQTLMEQIGGVLHLSGPNAHARPGPESRSVTERHHAHLMVALKAAEDAVHSLNLRPREAVVLAQSLRHAFDDVNEHARTLGYGLATLLASQSSELVMAMVRNPGAAARANNATARALSTLITAMKRVAQNRMEGDGGEAGLKLLSMIDGIVAPVRAALVLSRPGAQSPAA